MKQRKGLIVVMAVVFVLVMCLLGACDVNGSDHKYEAKYDETNHWQECSLCHEKKDVAKHDMTETVVAPTCTTTGYTTHKCKGCGYGFKDGETPMGAHDYETKYDETNHWQECSLCHEKKDVTAHTMKTTVVAPTCAESGYTLHACEGCNYNFKDTETTAAHSPEHIAAVAATLTTTGNVEHWRCASCGKTFDGEDCKNEINAAIPKIAKVILLAGQSNMVGHSVVGNIDSSLLEKYKKGFDNVKILLSCNPNQTKPVSSDDFVTVRAGMGKLAENGYEYFGPELGLAEYLSENYPDETFYLIKDASGATTLNANWYSPSSLGLLSKTELSAKSLYTHLLAQVERGMGLLADDGIDARIVSLMWMQGESDSHNMLNANRYGTLWNNFVKDVKGALADYIDGTAGLSTIDASITNLDRWQQHEIINTYKQAYATMSTKAYFFDVNGWAKTKSNDPAHLDSPSMLRLGQEFGKALDSVIATLATAETTTVFDGEGTEQSPYIVDGTQDFVKFAMLSSAEEYIDKCYKLAADVGSEAAPVKVFASFTASTAFCGNFDGDNHSVWLNAAAESSVGLFGYVGGATIANVKVYGTVTRNSNGGATGGIVGAAVYADGKKTTIKNCANYATVIASEYKATEKDREVVKGSNQAGGIVGTSTGNIDVIDCANHGRTEAKGSYAGGIVGRVYGVSADKKITVKLGNVTNDGEVTAAGANTFGGIAGNVGSNAVCGITYASAGLQNEDGSDIVVGGGKATVTHTAHAYAKVDGTEANCTETGMQEHYVCSHCGKLFAFEGEEYVEKTAEQLVVPVNDKHDFAGDWTHDEDAETHSKACSRNAQHKLTENCTLVKGDTVAPTFDSDGYTLYTCEKCGAEYRKDITNKLVAVAKVGDVRYQTLAEAIAAAGNDGIVTLLADGETKLADGQTLRVIKGEFALEVTTDVAGKFVNANTDSDGVTTYTLENSHVHEFNTTKHDETNHWQECTCGEKQNVEAHVFADTVKAATCTEGGYTTHTCECGYTYTDGETAAKGHTAEQTAEVSASYATAGIKAYYTCSNCGKVFADSSCTEEIAALEEWKTTDGRIVAQKDNADFVNSEENPFTIANATDYKTIADACNAGNKFVGKYIMLTANIGDEENPVKSRIGNASGNYFAGIFDGNGKTVYLQQSLSGHVGMFGVADHGAVIKNVTVNGSVTNTTATQNMGVGGIVGSVIAKGDAEIALTLINCTNNATISHTGSAVIGIGGLVGRFQTTGSVNGCVNNGAITAKSNSYVGGVVGYASNSLTITDCKNTANIVITEATAVIGGILGMTSTANANVTVKNCTVSDCELSGKGSVGGIVGRIYQGKVNYVNWTDDCVKNVTFIKNGVTTEAVSGIDKTDRTDSAESTPGIMFGTCTANGTANMVTE